LTPSELQLFGKAPCCLVKKDQKIVRPTYQNNPHQQGFSGKSMYV